MSERWRVFLLTALLLLAAPSCSKVPSTGAGREEEGPYRFRWIQPADGEAVSDTIRCEVRIEGAPVRRVCLFAGDSLVADDPSATERGVVPWTFRWLPPDTALREIRLRVAAASNDGRAWDGPEVKIRWSPNGVPSVRFVGLAESGCVERAVGESLRVAASDPEDGALTGSSVEWRSDRQGFLGFGEEIPVASLIGGRHTILVRATDRWCRSSFATARIELFSYTGGETPAGLLEDTKYALLQGRAEVYAEGLAASFLFIFCADDRVTHPSVPVCWDASEERDFVRECGTAGGMRFVEIGWDVACIQEWRLGNESLAKAELAGVDVGLVLLRAGPADTLSVLRGSARVYMRRETASDRWVLEQWRDLGAAGAMTQGLLRLAVQPK